MYWGHEMHFPLRWHYTIRCCQTQAGGYW